MLSASANMSYTQVFLSHLFLGARMDNRLARAVFTVWAGPALLNFFFLLCSCSVFLSILNLILSLLFHAPQETCFNSFSIYMYVFDFPLT